MLPSRLALLDHCSDITIHGESLRYPLMGDSCEKAHRAAVARRNASSPRINAIDDN